MIPPEITSSRQVIRRIIANLFYLIHTAFTAVFYLLSLLLTIPLALPLRFLGLDIGICIRVIDGDTFKVWVPLRPAINRIRLSKINAYEIKTFRGKLTKFIVQILLLPRLIIIAPERTRKGTLKKGRYGRQLAKIYCIVGSLGDFLLFVRLAKSYRTRNYRK